MRGISICNLLDNSLNAFLIVKSDGFVDVDFDVELVGLVLKVRLVDRPQQSENVHEHNNLLRELLSWRSDR